jgi:hypothetical protein
MASIGPVLDRLEADHANLSWDFLRLLEFDRMPDAAGLARSLWLRAATRARACLAKRTSDASASSFSNLGVPNMR